MKTAAIDLEQLVKKRRWNIILKALKKLKQDVESRNEYATTPKVFDLDKLSIDEEGDKVIIKHDE